MTRCILKHRVLDLSPKKAKVEIFGDATYLIDYYYINITKQLNIVFLSMNKP